MPEKIDDTRAEQAGDQPRAPQAIGAERDGQHGQRVHEVVEHAGAVDLDHRRPEPVAQAVRAERPEHHGREPERPRHREQAAVHGAAEPGPGPCP